MKTVGVYQIYDGLIYDRRQQGASLAQIGEEVGVTRERVRQLLNQHYGSTKIHSFLTTPELARLCNTTSDLIHTLHKWGILNSVNNGGNGKGNRALWDLNALKTLLAYRSCEICGVLLPHSRSSYCSPECSQVAWQAYSKKARWRSTRKRMGQKVFTKSTEYAPTKLEKFQARLSIKAE